MLIKYNKFVFNLKIITKSLVMLIQMNEKTAPPVVTIQAIEMTSGNLFHFDLFQLTIKN